MSHSQFRRIKAYILHAGTRNGEIALESSGECPLDIFSKLHWESDTPLEDTTDKRKSSGKRHWQSIGKCPWKSTMISEVSISGVQSFNPQSRMPAAGQSADRASAKLQNRQIWNLSEVPYRRLWKKHSSGEEDGWEKHRSKHQIRGWKAVSAAVLQGRGCHKRSVFSQTPVWAWELHPSASRICLSRTLRDPNS